jgi:integrase/recombinase XerC/integrase/recombinase XerD
MDMNTAIAEYCRHLELAGRSRLTVSSYRQDLTKLWAWLEGAWGGKPALADVTPVDLAEYRLYLMRYCRPATVNKALVVLKAFFAWAEKKGMITGNPAANLKPVREARPSPRWLDRRDQLRLLREVEKGKNRRDAAIIALLLYAGLRLREVINLRVGDVELSQRRGKVTVRWGKGEKWREVPLNRDARQALQEHLEALPGETNPDDWLFSTQRAKKMSPRALQHLVAKYGKRAGLEKLSPHVLRHTFCHNLVSRGDVPLDVVAVLAGHTTADGRPNLKTTLRYTTPSRRELQEAVERITWNSS